uniref:NADH-ubiquinone oxidoreductase chain 4 n=1 Tax=Liposcelis decolor TaxID=209926 RepID=X2C0I4_9NEOP|nr:NADH dehydrogenase subunit 4 [Liposcelis decolor]AFV61889.1 NADH dehydrogenase subunit 4 [Liposcelis decolor]
MMSKKENMLLLLIILFFIMLFYQTKNMIFTSFCVDNMSFLIVSLTLVLSIIMMSMFMEKHNYAFSFLIMILILTFLSNKMILFYIFFELSIAPIFMIIFYKGKQYERLKAGVYLMIYTLLASFPFLFYILNLEDSSMVWSMNELIMNKNHSLLLFFSYLAFLTKLPVFFLHLWLPKAHVEAPVYGSMILAGVMLKLGTFGLMKLVLTTYMIKLTYTELSVIFIYFSFISGMVCLFSNDLKVMIAFSSVSHMTFLVSCMNMMNIESSDALLINAVSHGFISSNLFFVLNVIYERSKSRSIFLSKSWLLMMNSWILLLCMSNFSAPPFISFFSEILLLFNFLSFSELLLLFTIAYLMVSTMYSLYVFYCMKTNKMFFLSKTLEVKEWKIMILLIIMSLMSVSVLNNFSIM